MAMEPTVRTGCKKAKPGELRQHHFLHGRFRNAIVSKPFPQGILTLPCGDKDLYQTVDISLPRRHDCYSQDVFSLPSRDALQGTRQTIYYVG